MLTGKIAIVTGASRGIGRAIALEFARNGVLLVLVATNRDLLEDVARQAQALGSRTLVIAADLAQEETPAQIAKAAEVHFGGVDILVNCAGTIARRNIMELQRTEHLRVFDVNLHAPIFLAQAVVPLMRKRGGGKIVNISSQMAKTPHPNAAVSYEASKAALSAATRHLALHLAPEKICVNAICPGSIDTDMPKSMTQEARTALVSKVPLRRYGQPEEVAKCALFLTSVSADYITGASIDVNGGSWMP